MPDFSGRQKDIDNILFGTPMTLAQAREFLDKVSGLSSHQVRLLSNWVRAYESKELQRHTQRVNAATEEVRARHESICAEADELVRMANEVVADVKAGKLTSAEGRKQLGKMAGVYRQLRQRAEQCESDEEAAEALAEQDPAEAQAYLVGKYPTLQKSLSTLSPGDLDIH